MLGLFALNEIGLTGGLLQMINHGLSTGALFLLVGMLYERITRGRWPTTAAWAAQLNLMPCSWCLSPCRASACRG